MMGSPRPDKSALGIKAARPSDLRPSISHPNESMRCFAGHSLLYAANAMSYRRIPLCYLGELCRSGRAKSCESFGVWLNVTLFGPLLPLHPRGRLPAKPPLTSGYSNWNVKGSVVGRIVGDFVLRWHKHCPGLWFFLGNHSWPVNDP